MTTRDRRDLRFGRRQLLAVIAAFGGCAPPRSRISAAPSEPPAARLAPPAVPAAAPVPPAPREPGLALFERLPELRHAVQHVALGRLPTPIEHYRELGERIGIESLWVKHDDLVAVPYGGGKIRKLEFFLAAAVHSHHRDVVTSGAVGSNHAVATAIFARQLGLGCHLLLMHGLPSDAARRNLLADAYHGATLELVGGPSGVAAATERLRSGSDPPYVIPGGGTSPLGNLGYVNAALELEQQVESGAMPAPDLLFVPLGTMGTAVGLTLGLELTNLPTRVVGVRASNVPTSTRARFVAELTATRTWLRERGVAIGEPSGERFRIEGGYLGRGYGFSTESGRAATKLAGEHGLELEETYTAKAFAAVIGAAREHRDTSVLFWQTRSAIEPAIGEVTGDQLPSELRGYFSPGAASSAPAYERRGSGQPRD